MMAVQLPQPLGRVLSDVRSRLFYKTLDAVATAPLRGERPLFALVKQCLDPRTANYDRVAAGVNALDELAPGRSSGWSERVLRSGQLPFCALGGAPTLLAYGSGSTVFLLRGYERPMILKIYRRSLGRNSRELQKLSQFYQGKYSTVRRWYAEMAELLVRSHFLILHSPLMDVPAVGVVQPYIDGKIRDLFTGFSDGALQALLQRDERLRAQVSFFAERTLTLYQETGRCIDFLGEGNVAIVRDDENRPVLAIFDFGIFELSKKRSEVPATYERVMERLGRLDALLRELGSQRARALPSRGG